MFKKLHKTIIGAFATITLIAGFMAAPAGMLPGSAGTQKAAAACSINVYQVVWGAAGVYSGVDWSQVGTLYYGQRIHGNTGGHRFDYYAGFGFVTSVYWGQTYRPFMRSDALQYIGCY